MRCKYTNNVKHSEPWLYVEATVLYYESVVRMTTRRRTVNILTDILRDVGDYMHEVMRKNDDKYKQVEDPVKTADTLGISAVMVQDMTGKR